MCSPMHNASMHPRPVSEAYARRNGIPHSAHTLVPPFGDLGVIVPCRGRVQEQHHFPSVALWRLPDLCSRRVRSRQRGRARGVLCHRKVQACSGVPLCQCAAFEDRTKGWKDGWNGMFMQSCHARHEILDPVSRPPDTLTLWSASRRFLHSFWKMQIQSAQDAQLHLLIAHGPRAVIVVMGPVRRAGA